MDVAQAYMNEVVVNMGITVLSAIGALYVMAKIGGAAATGLRYLFQSGIRWKSYGAGEGAWAIVTGCTDGIGKEFSKQLAAKGYNILLVSRTLAKLDVVSKEIENDYKVETKVLAMDFAKAGPRDYARLRTMCNDLPILILVNNVGVSHEHPEYFHEVSDERMEDIIEVNVMSVLKLTRIVLPQMLERKKGLILNMGSFSGSFPTPLLQVYSGTKSFLRTWSEAFAEEVSSSGIHVEHLNTYFVVSAMSKIRKPSLTTPTAKDYVKSSLKNIGHSTASVPYTMHNVVFSAFNMLPESILKSQNLALMEKLRKRALRKKEAAAKAE